MKRRNGLTPVQKRMCTLAVIFLLLLLGVLYRTFSYQVLNRGPWLEKLLAQSQSYEIIPAERGLIYDRNMNVLSMNMPTTSLAVDPNMPGEQEALACTLATVLGGTKSEYTSLFRRNPGARYLPLRERLTITQKKRLEAAGLEAVIFEESLQRIRPSGDLAVQLLGVTTQERKGAWGIEQQLNGRLTGIDGWAVEQKDGLNRRHESVDLPVQKPQAGNNVVLSIDHDLQSIVEEEMHDGVNRYNARFGTAVLVDPFSGDILAMTSVVGRGGRESENDFNEKMKNRAVQWIFEPGSVFKIVTLAAAFETKTFTAKSLIFCENGSYKFENHVIHDHEESYAWLTLKQVMAKSSNIGMAKVAQKMGSEVMFKYVRNFGFGNKTGIGLPGESAGILRPVYEWSRYSVASIAFGQEISATPLQVVSMAAAIANGGELMEPQLIKKITDPEGTVLKSSRRRVIRRVISQQTAHDITKVLVNVVDNGSGEEAAVHGISIAGKTGTAQKSIPGHSGYIAGANVCSFVGFWPAEAPVYAMLVVLDEPTIDHWGSRSAAPCFGRIVERIAGLPGRSVPRRQVTDNTGALSNAEAVFAAYENSPKPSPDSRQAPVTEPESVHHIPQLTGLSVRQALTKLSELKIKASIDGNGVVRRQEPAAGDRIEPGVVCRLFCTPLSGEN